MNLNLQTVQEHPLYRWVRLLITIIGIGLVVYLLVENAGFVVEALQRSPGLLAAGLLVAGVSLWIQVLGFGSFPALSKIPKLILGQIWTTAIVFNHVFPLAGGLGYRFSALRARDVPLKTTGSATLWFLATSGSTAGVSLLVLLAADMTNTALLIPAVAAGAGVLALGRARLGSHGRSFAADMVGYQLAQTLMMGGLVTLSAELAEVEISLSQGAVIGCLLRLGTLVSLTPAGLGVQEAIIIGVLSRYGVSAQESASVAIVVRVLYLLAAILMSLGSRLARPSQRDRDRNDGNNAKHNGQHEASSRGPGGSVGEVGDDVTRADV